MRSPRSGMPGMRRLLLTEVGVADQHETPAEQHGGDREADGEAGGVAPARGGARGGGGPPHTHTPAGGGGGGGDPRHRPPPQADAGGEGKERHDPAAPERERVP